MKLRVRIRKQTGRVELEEEQPSLGDLRRKLSTVLLPSLGYSNEAAFTITLNGKDALTEDQNTLASSGIVSGDLIVVLLPDSVPPAAPLVVPEVPGRCASSACPETPTQSFCSTASKRPKSQQEDVCPSGQSIPQTEVNSADDPVLPMEGSLIGSRWELMLCSEAVDGKIPHSLETLYHNAGCTNANDALIVVLHLLMLETGYHQQGAETKSMFMPEEWRSGGVYKLHYSHPLCEEGSATLACVPMGKLIVINATLKINNEMKSVKRLQLSTDSYISFPEKGDDVSSVYKDLQKLSRLFKDQLVYPLLAATRQLLNLPDVFGLIVLPLELKLRIFRLLDVRSLLSLSACCRDLLADTGDPSLWRFLYMRDFRDPIPRSRDTDWKELYKEKHRKKMETLRWRHMSILPGPAHPLPIYPNPYYPDLFPPNPTFPPGIIGGEYDQRPNLPVVGDPITSLFPGLGSTAGRFLPFRPHFDPIGPLSENNPLLPGRSVSRPSRGRGHDLRRAFI